MTNPYPQNAPLVEFECADCGVNTLDIGEYYQLEDEVWDLTGIGPRIGDGMLCIGCVELRLGRELVRADFHPCPLNESPDWLEQSPRLRSRLSRD
jgi:hypothetical protein